MYVPSAMRFSNLFMSLFFSCVNTGRLVINNYKSVITANNLCNENIGIHGQGLIRSEYFMHTLQVVFQESQFIRSAKAVSDGTAKAAKFYLGNLLCFTLVMKKFVLQHGESNRQPS